MSDWATRFCHTVTCSRMHSVAWHLGSVAHYVTSMLSMPRTILKSKYSRFHIYYIIYYLQAICSGGPRLADACIPPGIGGGPNDPNEYPRPMNSV